MAEKNPDASTADTTGASKKGHISGIPPLVQEQLKEAEKLQLMDEMAKKPDGPTTYTGARKEDYMSGIPPLVQGHWKEVVAEVVSKREELMEVREEFEQEKREIVEGVLDVIDGMAKEGKKEKK